MRLLLDTQLILWAFGTPEKLTVLARTLLGDPQNSLLYSPVSLLEIAIKNARGRPDFVVDAEEIWRLLLLHGVTELPIYGSHATAVKYLPSLHKDPFDRLLLAQALSEGMTLVTADRALRGYPSNILYVG